jgi:hypothetical protein
VALYHFTAGVVSRSQGHSAIKAAAYQSGERLLDERTGEVADYRAKGGVERSEIFAPANALGWAYERATLWNRAEGAEKRKDAQVARRIEFAGQRELTPEENWHAAGRFVRQELVRRGMIADVSMHDDGLGNPHFHVLVTMRRLNEDGTGFSKKDRSWNEKAVLEDWRKSWADIVNDELALARVDAEVDHRSNDARGLGQPTQHIGKSAWALHKTGKVAEPVHVRQVERIMAERHLLAEAAEYALGGDWMDVIATEEWPEPGPEQTWVEHIEEQRDIEPDRGPDFDL